MNKKWYKTRWGIIGIIFTPILIIGLIVRQSQIYKPHDCAIPDGKILQLSNQACGEVQLALSRQEAFEMLTGAPTSALRKEAGKKLDYEILEQENNGYVNNYKILIKPGDDGKAIATEVKRICNKPCNVNIYDDKRALELQKEYDAMMDTLETDPADLEAWKQKNYVFVADHFLGYMAFNSDDYTEDLYKDWYYEKLKGL